MTVSITASTVDGKTLEQFAHLIEQRRKYLNETTEQSVTACAITLLVSIRAQTRVANPKKTPDIKLVKQNQLCQSCKSVGQKRIPCLRFSGSRTEFHLTKGMVMHIVDKMVKPNLTGVWLWVRRNGTKYYIVAQSEKAALAWAKEKERNRIKHYAGLAKFALGLLMNKVAQNSRPTSINSDAMKVASVSTNVIKRVTGNFDSGHYSVTLDDQLDYALNALKGGPATITDCMQKAMNKIAGTINNKCRDVLGFQKIETPFPEVKRK